MAVPRKLQPLVGRREIKKSLRTADKAVAVPAAMKQYANYQEEFRRLEAASMSKIKKYGYDPVATDDELNNLTSGPEGSAGLITVQSRDADGSVQTITFDTGDADKDFEQAQNWAKVALPKGSGDGDRQHRPLQPSILLSYPRHAGNIVRKNLLKGHGLPRLQKNMRQPTQ